MAKTAIKAKPATKKASSDSFVPEDAISKGSSLYMKLVDGINKIRIISKPITGWLEWVDKKPLRTQIDDEPEGSDEENKPKKFIAVVVIDRDDDNKIKILELTQQSIIKAIGALSANPDWGNPFTYDLNIEKTGADLKTRYAVTPSPKKPLDKAVIKEVENTFVCLEALFENEDPWKKESGEATELFTK